MKKKLLIIFGSIFGVIAVLVILLFTLFALHSVSVDYRTSIDENMSSSQEIIEAGEFSYGSPVLFLSKKKYKENIEKSCPYVEVINIETVFPNKFVVHVKQRQKVYAFVHDEKTYYCDNNLSIVEIQEGSTYTPTNQNPILITGLKLDNQNLQLGHKIYDEHYVDFYDALLSNNRQLYEQQEMIKSIEFSSFTDPETLEGAPCITICTYDNHLFYIYNSNKLLTQKANKFLTAFSGLYDLIGKDIDLNPNSDYFGQKWTKEMLDSAYVIINNKYVLENNAQDVYANAIPSKKNV